MVMSSKNLQSDLLSHKKISKYSHLIKLKPVHFSTVALKKLLKLLTDYENSLTNPFSSVQNVQLRKTYLTNHRKV